MGAVLALVRVVASGGHGAHGRRSEEFGGLSAFLSPSFAAGIFLMAVAMPALQSNLFVLCSRIE